MSTPKLECDHCWEEAKHRFELPPGYNPGPYVYACDEHLEETNHYNNQCWDDYRRRINEGLPSRAEERGNNA